MKTLLQTFLLTLSLVVFNVEAELKPNVIIFLVDDLGWADISLRGAPFDTPNIDSYFKKACRSIDFMQLQYVVPLGLLL